MNCSHKKEPCRTAILQGEESQLVTTLDETLLLYSTIPSELKQYPNWVLRKNKVPYSVTRLGKKWKSLEDCGTYEDVIQALQRGSYDGIGFQLSNSPYTVIDLDHCIDDNGDITSTDILDLLMECGSYWEYSPSGTGIHIWLKGHTPRAVKNSPQGFEMYSDGRYITMTGNTPTGADIVENQPLIDKLYNTYKTTTASKGPPIEWGAYKALSDAEIDKKISDIAAHEKSGKFSKLFYNGDISLYGDDESRADSALCCILAWWCNGNPVQIEQVFNRSALSHRQKWSDRADYRKRTIENAIAVYLDGMRERLEQSNEKTKQFLWG